MNMRSCVPAGRQPAQRMSRRLGAAGVLLAALLLMVSSVRADDVSRFSIDQVLVSDDGQRATALVSVFDGEGHPLRGLTAFRTEIDGEPADPLGVSTALDGGRGIAVLLMMDVSPSMAGEPLSQARGAAGAFVEGLLERDVVAFFRFGSTAADRAFFSNERAALLAEIRQTEVDQVAGTALYDAVAVGLAETAARAPNERRAIVLLTDGLDTGVSAHTREETLGAAAAGGVPVFAIALGEEADATFLEGLAQSSSGGFYRAPAPTDVPAIFDAIGTLLRSQYVLELSLPASNAARRELVVSVDVGGETRTARASFSVTSAGQGESGPALAGPALLIAGAAALLLGAGGVVVYRRLRRGGRPSVQTTPGVAMPVRPLTSSPRPTSGSLMVVDGPNQGASLPLWNGAAEIGAGARCALRLDAVDGLVATTHLRVWLHGDRLMLHHLARGYETQVDGKAIDWATLGPSDALQIGPHVLVFRVQAQT